MPSAWPHPCLTSMHDRWHFFRHGTVAIDYPDAFVLQQSRVTLTFIIIFIKNIPIITYNDIRSLTWIPRVPFFSGGNVFFLSNCLACNFFCTQFSYVTANYEMVSQGRSTVTFLARCYVNALLQPLLTTKHSTIVGKRIV